MSQLTINQDIGNSKVNTKEVNALNEAFGDRQNDETVNQLYKKLGYKFDLDSETIKSI